MHELALAGCTASPFGSYLKALGVLRLISEQADPTSKGRWRGETFVLGAALDTHQILQFFLEQYQPTPIVSPWNGGSGFYPKNSKDRKFCEIQSIAATKSERFQQFRQVIEICRGLDGVKAGKPTPIPKGKSRETPTPDRADKEREKRRKLSIIQGCRNQFPDAAVAWLDAAIGMSNQGDIFCPPILGTGGNEGNFDYANNFASRIVAMLVDPKRSKRAHDLLLDALYGIPTTGLIDGASGQLDPGRSGGANQGPDVQTESPTNPWNFILMMEGIVAWSGGIHRRFGVTTQGKLSSPFTVAGLAAGYGSAAVGELARAETWTPLWTQPVGFAELRALLREGRSSVSGTPARDSLDFAEAVSSLGVNRGIASFARYSFVERRGQGYFIALPIGTFDVAQSSLIDLVRPFRQFLDDLTRGSLPKLAEQRRRAVDTALLRLLQRGGRESARQLMLALGQLLRAIVTSENRLPRRTMPAAEWVAACGLDSAEVRIAASLASLRHATSGTRMIDFLTRENDEFAWNGLSLPERMISTVERQLRISATREESDWNWSAYPTYASDTTLFIEGSVDDQEIEDLLFAFSVLDWQQANGAISGNDPHEVLPVYAALRLAMEGRRDYRIIAMLRAGDFRAAGDRIIHLLKVLQMNPINVSFGGSIDTRRLAASYLIPVKESWALRKAISMVVEEEENQYYESAVAE